MRGRKSRSGIHRSYDHIVQDIPKGRCRFDPQVTPEIIAWLFLTGARHAKMLQHMKMAPKEARSPYTDLAIRDQELRVEITSDLIRIVQQNWNRQDWLDTIVTTDEIIDDMESGPRQGPDGPPLPPTAA